MGEGKRDALRVDFDGQIRLEFHGAKVTSDAGLLAYRELDEALGLTAEIEELGLNDPRTGRNTRYALVGMLRQWVYRRLALPHAVEHWSSATLREKLIKIGAKIVCHARYVTVQMAEVAIPRKLFRAILQRIARLKMKRPLPAPE